MKNIKDLINIYLFLTGTELAYNFFNRDRIGRKKRSWDGTRTQPPFFQGYVKGYNF